MCVISIDANDTIVVDDAFSIVKLDNGDFKLSVYIANPAHKLSLDSPHYKKAKNKFIHAFDPNVAKQPMLQWWVARKYSLASAQKGKVLRFDIAVSSDGDARLEDISLCLANVTHRLNHNLQVANKEQANALPAKVKEIVSMAFECSDLVASKFAINENGTQSNKIVNVFMSLTSKLFTQLCINEKLPVIFRRYDEDNRFVGNHGDYELVDSKSYASVTSPLRRFEDLHNTLVVNAYLSGDLCGKYAIKNGCNEKQRLKEISTKKKRAERKKKTIDRALNRFLSADNTLSSK